MADLILPDLPRSPMYAVNGGMTIEWQDFFLAIGTILGGIDVGSLEDLWTAVINNIYATPTNYNKKIEELENKLVALPSPKSYDKEISDVKNMIEIASSKSTTSETSIEISDELEFYMQVVSAWQ